ncbi:MAG: AAA family ATPase [Thermoplasmata archaeon]|nr:AAA family ATPase [Thermoplasmata archaeon]
MVAIIVSGLPGAGKEEFVRIAMESGFSVIRMGDVVREYSLAQGLDRSDDSVGGHASSEREKHGKEIWAVRTQEKMPDGNVIIDGCRSQYELAYFEDNIEDMITVGIETSKENRFRRLASRKREDAPETLADFEEREERELGWGLKDTVDNAQIKLSNETSLEDFRRLCRTTLQAILDRVPRPGSPDQVPENRN